jgi:hypothetical protein
LREVAHRAPVVEQQQRRGEFHAFADPRHAEILRTKKTVLALVADEPAERPVARKLDF